MDLFGTPPHALPFGLPALPGYSHTFDAALGGWRIQVPGGQLLYIADFFDTQVCARILAFFQEYEGGDWQNTDWKTLDAQALEQTAFKNIRWKQDHIRMYGKTLALPRWTAWYGDAGAGYAYSGIKSEPNPWNTGLLYLKKRVEAACGARFNSVLLNWYRDGQDSLNWHADDERELGPSPTIASVNFGQTRDFLLRRNDDHQQKLCIPLPAGTLLLMAGELQQHWQHAVPVRKRVAGSRFNLTFRWIHA